MNELAHSISLIFEPDSAPVVAVSGGMILFHNAAALSLFPTIECGQRASAILPASFLNCDEPVFVSTAQVNRQSLSANGVWYSGMLLLRMNLVPAKYVFSPEALTVSMRLELSKMQMALDLLNRSESIIGDSATRSGIAVLYHSYYKLLRSCENLALAEQLMQRSIVYRPVSIEPAKWLRNLISLVTESASSLGVNIQLSCSDELPAIAADPDLLEQMMLNLLSNSLRHCQPGSSVSIRVSKKGANLQLIVDDNGAGFSSELLGTLFRRQLDNRPGQLSRSDQMDCLLSGVSPRCTAAVSRSPTGAEAVLRPHQPSRSTQKRTEAVCAAKHLQLR